MSAMPVQKICVVTALAMLAAFFFSPVVVFAQIVPPSFDEAPVKAVPAQPAPLQPIPVGRVQAPAALQTSPELGQTREDLVVTNAITVLEQFMRLPTKRIPGPLLRDAQAIAIIPNVIKGGFIVGIRHGNGVFLGRTAEGGFGAPRFISLTGGSVGFQAGVQSSDVILVFRTAQSVQNLMQGTFTLGVDAAAAAGPVGRQASAATNAQLNAEVWSYSRSRGAFVGVSLDGSALQIDSYADQLYYHTPTGVAGAAWPPTAHKLVSLLDGYIGVPSTTAVAATTAVNPTAIIRPAASVPSQEVLRGQLAATAPHLYAALPDEKWRNYLALPRSIYFENQPVDTVALQNSVSHFDAVSRSSEYHLLASEPVFQQVYGLLKRYTASATAAGLSLPPPPAVSRMKPPAAVPTPAATAPTSTPTR
jgi:lipid-binding SYLF domain-containing protein